MVSLRYRDALPTPVLNELDSLVAQVRGALSITEPIVGAIQLWPSTIAPDRSDWLICDGRQLVRAKYRLLFNLLSTTWGAGDGSTTFNIPNLQAVVPIAGTRYIIYTGV